MTDIHYNLFQHLSQAHGLTLTQDELQEIVNVAREGARGMWQGETGLWIAYDYTEKEKYIEEFRHTGAAAKWLDGHNAPQDEPEAAQHLRACRTAQRAFYAAAQGTQARADALQASRKVERLADEFLRRMDKTEKEGTAQGNLFE